MSFRVSSRFLPAVVFGLLAMPSVPEAAMPDSTFDQMLPYTNAIAKLPPVPSAPVSPRDTLAHPYRRFAFLYEDEFGNRIDTIDGRVTKDLGMLPDTTIQLTLSDEELRRAYDGLIAIWFWEIPSRPEY